LGTLSADIRIDLGLFGDTFVRALCGRAFGKKAVDVSCPLAGKRCEKAVGRLAESVASVWLKLETCHCKILSALTWVQPPFCLFCFKDSSSEPDLWQHLIICYPRRECSLEKHGHRARNIRIKRTL
jgi:hypothetical protein